MMAKKLKRQSFTGGNMKSDPTARAAKSSQQSNMVAMKPGGDPSTPTPSPVTTQPMKKVIASNNAKMKKVAKVKAKPVAKKAPNPTVKKRTVKK